MPKYVFSPKGIDQHGIITSSQLDEEEHNLILDVVNWSAAESLSKQIFNIAGRSIVFRSPTRRRTLEDALFGDYDGLQLIGAGGNILFVQNGVITLPEEIEIFPVDSANHAHLLRRNSQLWQVNSDGKFEYSYRRYVPLHGMDAAEAENRARYSTFLENIINGVHLERKRTSFVVPKLAAQGYFPDMHDDNGAELQFQVYRVPLIDRLPGQVLHKYEQSSQAEFLGYLGEVSYYVGRMLRTFHSLRLAYMDPHAGNMSWIEEVNKSTLFTTDLGSIVDISDKEHASSYRGFDLFVYLTGMKIFLEKLIHYFESAIDGRQDKLLSGYLENIARHTMRGYFMPEINEVQSRGGAIDTNYFGEFSPALILNRQLDAFVELLRKLISIPPASQQTELK